MKSNKIRLGEQCVVTSSKRFHLSERITQGVPFYCSKEIIKKFNGEDVTECDYISEDLYKKVSNEFGVPKENDLLITTRGTIGIPYLYKRTDRFYFADGNLTWIKDFDSNLYSKFLYYWFQSYEGRKKFEALAKGTAQKAVPISGIKTLEIELPSLKSQKRIADILSAYDDLIENNQKQIKLLEEAAQRLYKEWFVDLRFPGHENTEIVDGVPEGWIKEEIGKIIKKVHRTKQIVASEYKDEGSIPIVDQSRAFVAGYTNDLEARVDFGIPIIVFGDHTRIVKLIQFPFAKGADGTQLIISDCLEMPQRLLYCSIMNVDLSNYHYARHFKYLKEEKIMIPTVKVANEFENNVTGIFSKIQNCRDEIIRCQKTRDLLLPKLMSGEVEV
ncbi:restriction endonuclease subunit S [Faecalibacterium hominis (ex Afrizal et al. 2022)]|jgi:type I restriction enzyme S subunit|uniref:restriction endonuclease subunit S n=1 Tax=Faecalibacterium hominis (ex Afrizal et al. 2022) TaxID=2881265 RepID=UPI001D0F486C|nr:restriction endonuclease subunit S [Faecalibacterium hominis (ex Afrizal et al. 2022)]MCC2123652.1 restriction endonuclease subunit S [Faecalibacterium hominis (ex Afrizal et al. 2022)]